MPRPRRTPLIALLFAVPAAAGQGTMYAVDGERDVLLTVNLQTGATTDVGPLGFDGSFWGLAFNRAPCPAPGGGTFPPGTLFGVEVSTQALYTLNLATGQATTIGNTGVLGAWEPLTFDAAGNLWTIDVYDRFTLSTATGQATHAPGGFNVPGGVAYSMDTLLQPVPAAGVGVLPAGTIIACRAGQFFAVDGVTWHMLMAAPIPQAWEAVAAAPDGSIYAIGPVGTDGLWKLSLDPVAAEYVGPLGSSTIWGAAIIPAPAGVLALAAAACRLGARRRSR